MASISDRKNIEAPGVSKSALDRVIFQTQAKKYSLAEGEPGARRVVEGAGQPENVAEVPLNQRAARAVTLEGKLLAFFEELGPGYTAGIDLTNYKTLPLNCINAVFNSKNLTPDEKIEALRKLMPLIGALLSDENKGALADGDIGVSTSTSPADRKKAIEDLQLQYDAMQLLLNFADFSDTNMQKVKENIATFAIFIGELPNFGSAEIILLMKESFQDDIPLQRFFEYFEEAWQELGRAHNADAPQAPKEALDADLQKELAKVFSDPGIASILSFLQSENTPANQGILKSLGAKADKEVMDELVALPEFKEFVELLTGEFLADPEIQQIIKDMRDQLVISGNASNSAKVKQDALDKIKKSNAQLKAKLQGVFGGVKDAALMGDKGKLDEKQLKIAQKLSALFKKMEDKKIASVKVATASKERLKMGLKVAAFGLAIGIAIGVIISTFIFFLPISLAVVGIIIGAIILAMFITGFSIGASGNQKAIRRFRKGGAVFVKYLLGDMAEYAAADSA